MPPCEAAASAVVATDLADPHALGLAQVGERTAVGWIDTAGAHLAVIDAKGRPAIGTRLVAAPKEAPVELIVLGDPDSWVAVTRSSQWAAQGACDVEALRWNARGHRPERRVVIEDACPFETPAMAAVLLEGNLFVVATTAASPGEQSRDLRLTVWPPPPAIPQPLDALFTEGSLKVEDIRLGTLGRGSVDVTFSKGGDYRTSHLSPSGVPTGPTLHSATPPAPAALPCEEGWTCAADGGAVRIDGASLVWRAPCPE